MCMLNYTAINELKEDKPGDNVTVIINITNEHQCGSDGATNKTKISKASLNLSKKCFEQ